jgi:hypothetical protein
VPSPVPRTRYRQISPHCRSSGIPDTTVTSRTQDLPHRASRTTESTPRCVCTVSVPIRSGAVQRRADVRRPSLEDRPHLKLAHCHSRTRDAPPQQPPLFMSWLARHRFVRRPLASRSRFLATVRAVYHSAQALPHQLYARHTQGDSSRGTASIEDEEAQREDNPQRDERQLLLREELRRDAADHRAEGLGAGTDRLALREGI